MGAKEDDHLQQGTDDQLQEKLVVEVVAAHNLMPKDGAGSSSPYVEIEFERQRRRTRAKYKDLNPVWNEAVVFPVNDPSSIPYRSIDVAVYNERSVPPSSRNFLGRVRVSAAGVPAPGEEGDAVPQLFTLEKRSLFSHIRGEISLKLYRTTSPYYSVDAGTTLLANTQGSGVGGTATDNNTTAGTPNNKSGVSGAGKGKKQHHVHNANDHGGGGGGSQAKKQKTTSCTAASQVQQTQPTKVPIVLPQQQQQQQQQQGKKKNQNNNNNTHNHQEKMASPDHLGGNTGILGANGPLDLGQQQHPPVIFTTAPPPMVPYNAPYAGSAGFHPGAAAAMMVPGFHHKAHQSDFALKETRPDLGGVATNKDKTSSTYDLVEQMQYLYVRVVRARDMATSAEAHAEVKLGNYRGVTRPSPSWYWDQVFAYSKDSIQSSIVEVFVKDKASDKAGDEEYIGRLAIDLSEVPRRAPPDSTLAPQWYRMEGKKSALGFHCSGEVMVSAWFGTQADEAFSEAWHSKAAGVQGDGLGSIKSKVYLSPKLWYLRVTVVEAQDLAVVPAGWDKGSAIGRFPELSAKAQVGNQMLRTRSANVSPNRNPWAPFWNEDLMFVVAEPFEDYLVLWIDDQVSPGREQVLGRVVIPVSAVERRFDNRPTVSRWFALDRNNGQTATANAAAGYASSRVHLRLCLEGGYHVLDESTLYCSDLRPTAKQLWQPHVGVLEMGIIGASGLMPTKVKQGRGATADPYCVAKYGNKWVRTRTVVDSVSPRWNEQYTWEVFDPCTAITIGVFDNGHVDCDAAKAAAGVLSDTRIGKVRIRLSTLETDRVYTHAYPLLALHPTGVKKMGEIQLAVRFSCANAGNLFQLYIRPLLPKMHYVEPLMVRQVENLRYQATNVVAARLSRAEPPLGREVVEYMLDHGSNMWSMRRSKANFFRLVSVLSGPISAARWLDECIRNWQRPVHSVMFSFLFFLLLISPELILPTAFATMAVIGLWRYRSRPRDPPHMDARLSQADNAYADELDEELDTFPSSRAADVVRMRYDRLRSVAGRVQTVVGDLGSQGERVQALLGWRDPRATVIFLLFCLAAAVLFYSVPVRVVIGLWGAYLMRPPRFRSRLPSPAMSFFRRLPTKADSLL